jgi:polyphosphate glucokinase
MAQYRRKKTRARRILSVDVGGTGIKVAIIDPKGRFLSRRRRVKTPHPCPPKAFLNAFEEAIAGLEKFDCVSIGFPGYVRDGIVYSGPNLAPKDWSGIPLADILSKILRVPVRVANDADMQGLAAIKGSGLEFVCTLGTGFGTAWFRDGELMPHMEIGLSPAAHDLIYDAYIGDAALKKIGVKKWNHRLKKMLPVLHRMLNYDHIYIGGGNTRHIRIKLPANARIVSNNAGIKGGAGLWHRPGKKR